MSVFRRPLSSAPMVGSYSPHSDAGGTLHLPSPTHIHHVDPTLAFKELRRSLSRSPSKGPTFRLVSSKSASPIPRSPLSPSPETQQAPPNLSTALSLSPFATPLTTSTRKTRPSTRRISPMRSSSRSTSSQRSPRKRTLNESADSGNAPPRSSSGSSDDQENIDRRNTSPGRKPLVVAGLLKASAPSLQSSPLPLPRGTTRFEKGCNDWSVKSSPLKRSDGIMNFDQGDGGSPSAKRRSLHAGILGADFDIFDQEAAIEGLDTQMTGIDYAMESLPSLRSISPMPKRTSSLRKTTLQQRHEKPLFAKPRTQTDATNEIPPGMTGLKGRLRASLDSVLPSMSRDSPFSSQGGLPSASAHPLSNQYNRQAGSVGTSHPQRHPLSRTISQSTSNSSMAEDSPTHIPVRQPENHRPFMDFSRSLPAGALRPEPQDTGSSSQLSSGTSFATPENYKLVKPLPAAFMSTGLISKRHKNIEDSHPTLNASTNTMPDTPCKRHSLAELPSPSAPSNEIFGKSHQVRHSFGTPSTPFNPHVARASPETFGKGVNIFGAGFGSAKIQRRVSFLGREGDETFHFPSQQGDSQSSAELDIPPTPTKQTLASAGSQPSAIGLKSTPQDSAISLSDETAGMKSHSPLPQNCKSFSDKTPQRVVKGSTFVSWENTPSAVLRSTGLFVVPRSFTASRLLRNSKLPAPLNESCFSLPPHDDGRSLAKLNSVNPASPLHNPFGHVSPHTPRETMVPPDPSGLSISAHGDDQFRPPENTASRVSFPPATPTAPRGSVLSFSKSNASVTPSHTPATVEVDPVLTSRFDRVEMIGTGEFSQVFKVSKLQEPKSSRSYFSLPLTRASPKTPLPDRVWAVKKTRHPYIGPKDRQRKLQEVETLRTLGQSDHTLELFDSWEDKNHLYIQTEFCEEGSLDMFLDNAGRQARLDDFRIWKILLEMSLVSRHV